MESGQPEQTPSARPEKQHQWLQRLVGEWTYEGEAPSSPGQPPARFGGAERVRSLGDLWILAEGHGDMPGGGTSTTIMTLGYDPRTRRYVGTWIGSMMAHLWIYDGELDAAERVLTLSSEGPGMAGDGTMARYRDMITLESDDHRVLTGYVQTADGSWQPLMTAHYRRRV